MTTIDLNADLGEGSGHDHLLIPLASSVNIACGGHAGDPETIHHTITLAKSTSTAIGAHPGYEDRPNFGRLPLTLSPVALADMLRRQLITFQQIATDLQAHVHHVKPHGALYLQADQSPEIATIFAHTTATIFPGIQVYCPPSGALPSACQKAGLIPIPEGFADRRYSETGTLLPRSAPHAVLENPAEAIHQALQIIRTHTVSTLDGTAIPLNIRTLCIHGDGPEAPALLAALRHALESSAITIQPP